MRASERIADVQVLRGIAATMVVVHHFAAITKQFSSADSILRYHFLSDVGASGVDIFFCISGFVMMVAVTKLQREDRFSIFDFMARRAIRILPLYWILTAVLAALVLLCAVWNGPFSNALSVPLTPKYLLISYTLLPSYMPGMRTIAPFLFQGWTLSYEFYFYIFIACAASVCKRALHLAMVVCAAIVGLVLAARVLPASGAAIQLFLADSIVFEFLFGVWIFLLARSAWKAPRLCIVVGVAGLLATVFLPAIHTERVLRWGIPSALIVLGAVTSARRERIYRLPQRLGDASYSIYLFHLIPLYVYAGLLRGGYIVGSFVQYIAMAAGCLVALLAGLGVYRWAEKPLIVGLNRWYSARRQKPCNPFIQGEFRP